MEPVIATPVIEDRGNLNQKQIQNQQGVEIRRGEYTYVPITQTQPVFAEVVGVENNFNVPPDVMGILQTAHTISIRQHVKVLPKKCLTCPPCVRQANTYSVFAGVGNNAEAEFLRIDEVSEDWNRCCCAPYHPMTLEARQYIPGPGDYGSSDAMHIGADLARDWQRFTRQQRALAMRDLYQKTPVLFSMVRNDGMRCCKFPCKCLTTFVCCGCCQDGMHIYSGSLENEPDEDKGRHPHLDQELHRLVGSATQPQFGGWCIPRLDLRKENTPVTEEPYAKVEGPCLFGGWSEMCCSFKFYTSLFGSPSKTGDVALITKKKPVSMSGALQQLVTEADNYSIEFSNNSSSDLSGAQKLTILTSQILLDYMLFDGNTEKCRWTNEGIYCYLCYCSIIGCLVPCTLFIPTKKH